MSSGTKVKLMTQIQPRPIMMLFSGACGVWPGWLGRLNSSKIPAHPDPKGLTKSEPDTNISNICVFEKQGAKISFGRNLNWKCILRWRILFHSDHTKRQMQCPTITYGTIILFFSDKGKRLPILQQFTFEKYLACELSAQAWLSDLPYLVICEPAHLI